MSPSRAQEDSESLSQRVGDLDQYLIDLKGYLVLKDALLEREVDDLNQQIDAQVLPPPTTYNRFGTAPLGAGFLGWHPSFVALVDHPSVIDMLQFLLGPTILLDSIYGIYEERFVGEPLNDKLTREANIGAESRLSCSVVWNMTDTGPGIGGLCCVEGSHHVRRAPPSRMNETAHSSPHVLTPDAPARSAFICTSRLLHGNGRWLGPHQRRSLVFKYTTALQEDPSRRISLPAFDLTQRQRTILGHLTS